MGRAVLAAAGDGAVATRQLEDNALLRRPVEMRPNPPLQLLAEHARHGRHLEPCLAEFLAAERHPAGPNQKTQAHERKDKNNEDAEIRAPGLAAEINRRQADQVPQDGEDPRANDRGRLVGALYAPLRPVLAHHPWRVRIAGAEFLLPGLLFLASRQEQQRRETECRKNQPERRQHPGLAGHGSRGQRPDEDSQPRQTKRRAKQNQDHCGELGVGRVWRQ